MTRTILVKGITATRAEYFGNGLVAVEITASRVTPVGWVRVNRHLLIVEKLTYGPLYMFHLQVGQPANIHSPHVRMSWMLVERMAVNRAVIRLWGRILD